MNINPADTPFGPPDATPAVKRAGRAIWEHDNGYTAWPPAEPLEIGPAEDAGRAALAAGLDIEAVAEELARQSSAYLWSTDHRDLLVEIAKDVDRADAIIKESQQGVIEQKRRIVADVRAAILGDDS